MAKLPDTPELVTMHDLVDADEREAEADEFEMSLDSMNDLKKFYVRLAKVTVKGRISVERALALNDIGRSMYAVITHSGKELGANPEAVEPPPRRKVIPVYEPPPAPEVVPDAVVIEEVAATAPKRRRKQVI